MDTAGKVVLGALGVISVLSLLFCRRKKSEEKSAVRSSLLNDFRGSHVASSRTNSADRTHDQTSAISLSEAKLLSSLLMPSSVDENLLQKTLITIGNKAAFTCNQNILREAGCLQRLVALVKSYSVTLQVGGAVNTTSVQCALVALNNLVMNECNQKQAEDCIPSLLSLVSSHTVDDRILLAALEVLTNLAVLPTYHDLYVPFSGSLCDLVTQSANVKVKIQSLKLLVNLTSSESVVRNLLVSENLSGLLHLINDQTSSDVLLRLLTCLINIQTSEVMTSSSAVTSFQVSASRDADVTSSVVADPTVFQSEITSDVEKNACTAGSEASGVLERSVLLHSVYTRQLHEKLLPLCRSSDQDIRLLALRLTSLLPHTREAH